MGKRRSIRSVLFGDRRFYRYVLGIAVPVMIQNAVTNFVNLLDNIMVGRCGTEQMSGVSIGNTLIFVFNLAIFGALSGASIFGSQYYGKRDYKGMAHTLKFRLYSCVVIAILGILVFLFGGEFLIGKYLTGEAAQGDIALTLSSGRSYLHIMLFGLIPYAVAASYASAMRETGETKVPMIASGIAVGTNLVLNYLLIFGKFGFPELGVQGAAIATVISRFIECAIDVIYTHVHPEKFPYIVGLYKQLGIPMDVVKKITLRGLPLLINEFLWAVAVAIIAQCYSTRGLDVVAATNISNTINNLFSVVYMALGSSIGIVVGPLLGADEMDEAMVTAVRMLVFSVLCASGIGVVLAIVGPFFPMIYNTTDEVRYMASRFILINACCMPIYSYSHAAYFTVRTGGKTGITFLFDSMYQMVICMPVAYVLAHFTELGIYPIFIICQMLDIIKCTVGTILIKKGVWMNNLVKEQ